MPSVYVETSVFSAYSDQRDDVVSRYQQAETRRWWARREHFDLFTSVAVIAELERMPFPGQDEAVALSRSLPLLAISEQVADIAAMYRKHYVMPDEEGGDALHLAADCVHEMDFLLTWNCAHLANASKTRHILAVNARLELFTPRILTPPMLGEEG